jgi:hypothetical protein
MNYPNISMYAKISDIHSAEIIPIDIFLDHIRTGEWQDIVIPIRATKDKKTRDDLKKDIAPSVTLSGRFLPRIDDKCVQHSGFIGVDIDDLGASVEAFKTMVAQDKYTYATFTSISGYGVCVVVKIDPDRHRDAYLGLAAYYLQKYKQPVDPTGINPSRARFVSFDPNMPPINENSEVFKKYLPKEKKQKPPPVVFVKTEFDDIVRQMVDRRVNCCEDYRDWLKICFALCNRFGESGRHYFHSLSALSAKYSPEVADKQYDICLKHEDSWAGKHATLSTIYYHAKLAGINIASEKTKRVSAATTAMKKSGLGIEQIIANLEKFDGIQRSECEHIVKQAFDSGSDFHEDSDTLIDSVLSWLRANYSLRRNAITLRIENAGRSISDDNMNTIYLHAKKVFSDLTFDLFMRCIHSDFTPTYNPFLEWWEYKQDEPYNDEIMRFWRCITLAEGDDWDKMVYFGTKWMVGIISCIYGNPSPLYLTFTGPIGIGKTRIFRHLLPQSWRSPVDYYTESATLGNSKDDDILMCQKILIVDDEFGGMSKREDRKFKATTDKDTFSIRPPYGRAPVDMKRLCALGATCNEGQVLPESDNRRILPFAVESVDWEAINMINRDALFAELFRKYHAGFDWTVIKKDIEILAEGNDKFIDFTNEYELINAYYELPTQTSTFGLRELTASQIKVYIDNMSGQRTNLKKIGQELQKIGFAQSIKKINGRAARVYTVIEKRWDMGGSSNPQTFDTGNPF